MGQLQTEIQRLRGRIAELEDEKADVEAFAAVAAHELLAPLVLADAYATTVSERLEEDRHADARRDLDALRRAASRTRLLVETLLHDARSHERPLRLTAIDLNAVLSECLTLLQPEIEVRDAEVQVAELPEAYGEETLIGAVFSNLLLNALRYGPREHARILVDACPRRGSCRFSVQSGGPTIPAADRERIFERLPARPWRAPRARRRPRADDLPPHRRAPRRPDRRHRHEHGRQPLLLHPAGVSPRGAARAAARNFELRW